MQHKIIFKALIGSQAHGTSLSSSDLDFRGVFIQPNDEILGFKYLPYFEVSKDESYHEIARFLELLSKQNPECIQLLFSPQDCIVQTSPQFQLLYENRFKFLTKNCKNSFGNYAKQQIQRSYGLNKKINIKEEDKTRKSLSHFCYVYEKGKTFPLQQYLKKNKMEEKYCGMVALDHMRDCYALYYDYSAQYENGRGKLGESLGYRGITSEDGLHVITSIIPKYVTEPKCMIMWNKDAYNQHIKAVASYNMWLEKRNEDRYQTNIAHGQAYDGKNIQHSRRLIDMAIQIAKTGNVTIRVENPEELIAIKLGKVDLKTILEKAEVDADTLDELYANSDLPDDVDPEFVHDLLVKIRHI